MNTLSRKMVIWNGRNVCATIAAQFSSSIHVSMAPSMAATTKLVRASGPEAEQRERAAIAGGGEEFGRVGNDD
ncbi:hypothetical protein ACMFMF_009975 [Clarireedia jacksonii]